MTFKPIWFGYYLLAGAVLQIIVWQNLNVFNFHLWLHVVFWLPILAFWIVMHFIRLLFWLVLGTVLMVWLLSMAFPQVRNFVTYTFTNAMKKLGWA